MCLLSIEYLQVVEAALISRTQRLERKLMEVEPPILTGEFLFLVYLRNTDTHIPSTICGHIDFTLQNGSFV